MKYFKKYLEMKEQREEQRGWGLLLTGHGLFSR